MSHTVHILATCTNLDLLPSTLMVFDTVRTGFPSAEIQVAGNNLPREAEAAVIAKCVATNAHYYGFAESVIHGDWMEAIIAKANGPVVFVDTDVVFWASVEGWRFATGIAGRYIGRFHCPFTRCISEPRLHSSLLFVNPEALEFELAEQGRSFRASRFSQLPSLWRAVVIPSTNKNVFFDTGSLAFRAIGGTRLNHAQLDAYDHLYAGTWVDELSPCMDGMDLITTHRQIWANPSALRGAWRSQEEWFNNHAGA